MVPSTRMHPSLTQLLLELWYLRCWLCDSRAVSDAPTLPRSQRARPAWEGVQGAWYPKEGPVARRLQACWEARYHVHRVPKEELAEHHAVYDWRCSWSNETNAQDLVSETRYSKLNTANAVLQARHNPSNIDNSRHVSWWLCKPCPATKHAQPPLLLPKETSQQR